ncbi:hypothetical protein ISF_00052 [Cordyceps fumosorosea ARSEF 2679]|uniref:mRNA splicing factor RNA helicase n=1 Tax=Cordyceps fumosorosea (strain ARSEF 2679) TaxID=1081104 RepID=A0A168DYB2_CORFA|nr:hypothetical protein ISF_00052 [Cordyceps fumosorosea ARSEF 2679]OAA73151.1 hypothetical protein ISF_00052 [Cordyceps fumosorosea ARSEF 2679]
MEPDEPGIRFKAKKRTKTLRQRDASPEAPPTTTTYDAPPTATLPDHNDDNGDEVADGNEDASAVQAALKLRQARGKSRRLRGGVAFGRDEQPASGAPADDTSLVLRDAVAAQGLPDRFMHQTGFVADADDKHLMAYVESRLSSRAAGADTAAAAAHTELATGSRSKEPLDGRRREHAPGTVQTGTSTTSWPKLVEVPVPVDPRGTKRKTASAEAQTTTTPQPPRRRRNRRGSDDMKRDAMVEAFLHENKLDVYDVPTTTPATATGGDVDDALAADFRRQYMDEVAARRQRRRPAVNQPRMTQRQQAHQQAVAAGEVLRGPKLGGSRNARAAVRDALLQQQEQKKREGR